MGLFRIISFSLLVLSLTSLTLAEGFNVKQKACGLILLNSSATDCNQQNIVDFPETSSSYHSAFVDTDTNAIIKKPTDGGIREIVPKEFQERYQKWKDELLATEFGRQQWERFSNNKQFILTIVVSDDKKFGAGTDGYKWAEDGELAAATITLGKSLDKGYPDPIYYPVMNSLSSYDSSYEISGNILASTKMAHEIGHVNFTAQINSNLFPRQNKLMMSYNKIFLNNGHNTKDPRLIDLANELGGMPIKIWEDREYWGEVNAMRYLAERINKEYFYCPVFNRIKRNISDYAKDYQDRFNEIVEAKSPAVCRN